MRTEPVKRITCLMFAILLVLPMAALAEFDPKKGGLEAEGSGKKIKKIKTIPAGPRAAGKVIVPPAKAAILECNGTFRGTAKVHSRIVGPVRQFAAGSPTQAQKNVGSVKIRPRKFKLRQNGLRTLDISGFLANSCKKGSLRILVSWPGPVKKGRQTFAKTYAPFSIAPLLQSAVRLPIKVQGRMLARSELNYFYFSYAFRCCPNISGRYKITIDRSNNVKKIKIKPSSIVCSPGARRFDRHETRITGSLADHTMPGTVDFKVTLEGGGSCLGRAYIWPPKRK